MITQGQHYRVLSFDPRGIDRTAVPGKRPIIFWVVSCVRRGKRLQPAFFQRTCWKRENFAYIRALYRAGSEEGRAEESQALILKFLMPH